MQRKRSKGRIKQIVLQSNNKLVMKFIPRIVNKLKTKEGYRADNFIELYTIFWEKII